MTAKRWEIINEEFISYTGGTAQLISNGECKIHLWENPKDAQLFCDKLNAINKENEQLKTTIQQLTNDNTKQKKKLNTTMKENEQLKSDATTLIYHNQEYRKEIESLKEENKFLQNKVATYKTGNRLLKKTLDKEMK